MCVCVCGIWNTIYRAALVSRSIAIMHSTRIITSARAYKYIQQHKQAARCAHCTRTVASSWCGRDHHHQALSIRISYRLKDASRARIFTQFTLGLRGAQWRHTVYFWFARGLRASCKHFSFANCERFLLLWFRRSRSVPNMEYVSRYFEFIWFWFAGIVCYLHAKNQDWVKKWPTLRNKGARGNIGSDLMRWSCRAYWSAWKEMLTPSLLVAHMYMRNCTHYMINET